MTTHNPPLPGPDPVNSWAVPGKVRCPSGRILFDHAGVVFNCIRQVTLLPCPAQPSWGYTAARADRGRKQRESGTRRDKQAIKSTFSTLQCVIACCSVLWTLSCSAINSTTAERGNPTSSLLFNFASLLPKPLCCRFTNAHWVIKEQNWAKRGRKNKGLHIGATGFSFKSYSPNESQATEKMALFAMNFLMCPNKKSSPKMLQHQTRATSYNSPKSET